MYLLQNVYMSYEGSLSPCKIGILLTFKECDESHVIKKYIGNYYKM